MKKYLYHVLNGYNYISLFVVLTLLICGIAGFEFDENKSSPEYLNEKIIAVSMLGAFFAVFITYKFLFKKYTKFLLSNFIINSKIVIIISVTACTLLLIFYFLNGSVYSSLKSASYAGYLITAVFFAPVLTPVYFLSFFSKRFYNEKRCPSCKAYVLKTATNCDHCHHYFSELSKQIET